MSAYFPPAHLWSSSFTASAACRITEVNQPVQRDWRKRGLLSKAEGWARFSPDDLVHVALRDAMRLLGLPHTDPAIDLRDVATATQSWAATYPGSIGYNDGLEPSVYPRSTFIDEPRFRYAYAVRSWLVDTPLQLAADYDDLRAVLTGDDERVGIALIDIRSIGLSIAAKAGEPLWYVSSGPGVHNITAAQNAAVNGDKAAQKALKAIGQEWDPHKL